MTKKDEILNKAVELLRLKEDGIRYSELIRQISLQLPDFAVNTIHGTIWNLEVRLPGKVFKPAKGIFKLIEFQEIEPNITDPPIAISAFVRVKEEDFYEPFADYIMNELEECTKAIALGGSKFKDKWGTPDVLGIKEPRKSDIIKFPTEIVSVEIKIDTSNLITAFGQACSYKLFSHKTYIVVPNSSTKEDIDRIDSLAMIFGIGLILFDPKKPTEPAFEIRTRAARHEPDMFYSNKYMRLVEDELFS